MADQKNCEHCGSQFSHGRSDKKFCTISCGAAYANKRRNAAVAAERLSKRSDIVCKSCSKSFTPKRADAVFCSRDCTNLYYLAMHRENTAQRREREPNKVCSHCSSEFRVSRIGQKHCSDSCAKMASYKRMYPGLAAEFAAKIEAEPLKECLQCSSKFKATHRDLKRQKFCSTACNNRYYGREAHARRSEKMIAECADHIDWLIVADKYEWRCGMCRCDVLKEHRGKRLATTPEIDHVIPLSKGGTHNYSNVQLLCFSCNRSKWAQIIPGQVSLFVIDESHI